MATPRRQIQLLRRWQSEADKDINQLVYEARKNVRRTLQDAISDKPNLARRDVQNGIYRKLAVHWEDLGKEIDKWAFRITHKVGKQFHEDAVEKTMADAGKSAVKSRVVKYSEERAKKVFELIHPGNDKALAGVFTDKMDQLTLNALRQSVVSINRKAAIEGWTSNRIHRELQDAWGVLARDLGAEKFVDVSGRRWDNSNYLRMLTRTTTARVARESYNQTLVDNGDDLIKCESVGDSCPICKAWDQVIISISGTNPNYPSYQEAINAGMWHPNCDCLSSRVDETLDTSEISTQGERANVDWNDPDAVASYRDGKPAPTPKKAKEKPKSKAEPKAEPKAAPKPVAKKEKPKAPEISKSAFESNTKPLRKKASYGDEVVFLNDGQLVWGIIDGPDNGKGILIKTSGKPYRVKKEDLRHNKSFRGKPDK